jgi:hypothetical protein
MSRFHTLRSKGLPMLIAGILAVSAGPGAISTLVQTSLTLAQISMEVCLMGIAFLRICGI